jgi:hypothetical protein
MKVWLKRWEKNKNSVSVNYGPLTFSLKIKEKWVSYGNRNPNWKEWEVFPDSDWNYGLVLDSNSPEKSFEVVKKGKVPPQPFTPENAPIEIKAKARKILEWQMDRLALVGLLQDSPAFTKEPIETVVLIPMGAARLRISSFPEASDNPNAHKWTPPPQVKKPPFKITASHVNPSDSLEAAADGIEPSNSNDHSIPRFTWWDHRGTKEWIQFDFEKPRKISGLSVYWFDDTGVGSCRIPESWQVLYKDGNDWKSVENTSDYQIKKDAWSVVNFKTVQTTAIRIEVKLKPNYSGGILECKLIE